MYIENGIAIVGTNAGHIWRSNNFGANWADLGVITSIFTAGLLYFGNGIVIAGDTAGHIFRSTNYGSTWTDLGPISNAVISSSYLGNGIAIMNDSFGHVWKSVNYGLSWTDLGAVSGTRIGTSSYLSNGITIFCDNNGHIFRNDVSYKLDEAQVNYPRIPVDMTVSRAFNTTYNNSDKTRTLMISVYGAFLITVGGGTAEIQAVADTNVLPITPISDNVGIVGGLNGQSNRIPLYAYVKPGFNYRVDSSVLNGTATKLSWFETYI